MSARIKKRKKVCPCCGRKLWLKDYYRDKYGIVSSYCKECVKAKKRAEYAAGKKKTRWNQNGFFHWPSV